MNSSGHMYCTSCGVRSHKSPQSQERRRLPQADLLPTPCSWHGTSPRTARQRCGRSPVPRVRKTKKKLFPSTCALTHVNWSGLSWTTATRPGRPFKIKFSFLNIVFEHRSTFSRPGKHCQHWAGAAWNADEIISQEWNDKILHLRRSSYIWSPNRRSHQWAARSAAWRRTPTYRRPSEPARGVGFQTLGCSSMAPRYF